MVETITLRERRVEARMQVVFGAVRQLAVPVQLGTSFIEKYVRGIFPDERKKVPHKSNSVHNLEVYEEAETKDERPARYARTKTLVPWSKTPVLGSTTASGIAEGSPLQDHEKNLSNMVPFGIVDIFLKPPLR